MENEHMDIGRTSSKMRYSALTNEDIPHISNLLISVWPKLYGAVGHPLFSEDYLRWIYGGPDKHKHVLIGARLNDDLVSFQCFLYRTISYLGNKLDAYLWTHTTTLPELPPSTRMNCAFQLAKQGVLFDKNSEFYRADCDLVYAFNEADKKTRHLLDRFLKKSCAIDRKISSEFNQFILLPNKLINYVNEKSSKQQSFVLRAAKEEESNKLAELFNQTPSNAQFVMVMTEEELRHHFFGHHEHHTYVIDQDGVFKALINFFPIQIIKENKKHVEVIVEFLIANAIHKEFAAQLLMTAVRFAEKINAKAVVLENANYLDYDLMYSLGLMPTLRKMTMSTIAKDGTLACSGAFRCDIK
jgi:hypothetical protein